MTTFILADTYQRFGATFCSIIGTIILSCIFRLHVQPKCRSCLPEHTISHPLVSAVLEYVLDNNYWPETFPSFTGKVFGQRITNMGFFYCCSHSSNFEIFSDLDVLLTVHLSIFISVFNQLDAQNLFHNNFYFMLLHVSSTCAHHHTYRCDDTRGCVMQF